MTLAGVPGVGERVDASPANWLRDFFLANDRTLSDERFRAGFGRMTFTYGEALHLAWADLQADGYVDLVGDVWVWL